MLTAAIEKSSRNTIRQDYDNINDSFDFALSPEILNWFKERSEFEKQSKKPNKGAEFDEYELSLI